MADKLPVRFPKLRVIFTGGYSRDRDETRRESFASVVFAKTAQPDEAGKIGTRHSGRRNEAYQFVTWFVRRQEHELRLRGA